jgi:hypothetical protein
VAAVFFLSTLTRSTFGFGDALVAMPLLFLFIDVDQARPLGALMSVATAILIVAQDWRRIHFRSVWRLIVAALFGMPLGHYVLAGINPALAKATLALALLAFSVYSLVRPRLERRISEHWIWPTGLCAGALGMAFNMPGPVLVVYGTLRQWRARRFRATLQGYFLPTGTIILLWHVGDGAYRNWTLLWLFLISLPFVVLAIPLGRMLNNRVRGRGFERYVYVLLLLMSLVLLANAAAEFRGQIHADNVLRSGCPTPLRLGAFAFTTRLPETFTPRRQGAKTREGIFQSSQCPRAAGRQTALRPGKPGKPGKPGGGVR